MFSVFFNEKKEEFIHNHHTKFTKEKKNKPTMKHLLIDIKLRHFLYEFFFVLMKWMCSLKKIIYLFVCVFLCEYSYIIIVYCIWNEFSFCFLDHHIYFFVYILFVKIFMIHIFAWDCCSVFLFIVRQSISVVYTCFEKVKTREFEFYDTCE